VGIFEGGEEGNGWDEWLYIPSRKRHKALELEMRMAYFKIKN
jgi:hypothetical protein